MNSLETQLLLGFPTYRTYNKNYTIKVRFYSEELCYITEYNNIDEYSSLSIVTNSHNKVSFTSPSGEVYSICKEGDDFWTFIPEESGYNNVLQ